MLEQYKRTFVPTQLIIAIITLVVLVRTTHQWFVTAVFFFTMQVGALAGSLWAARLRRRLRAAGAARF
jgi:hypothetical protein